MLKANEGKQLPQMEYRELLRKLDDDSPVCAKSDAQPLRTSTILVLMAGVASAIVRYIANIHLDALKNKWTRADGRNIVRALFKE